MNAPHPDHALVPVLIDQLDLYGKALQAWMGTCNFLPDGRSMNIVMATPDRAYATLKSMLEDKYGPRSEKLKLSPYPFGALSRGGLRFAFDRFRGHHAHVYVPRDQETAWKFLWPRPWDIDFTLELFAGNFATVNPFMGWVMEQLSPEGRLLVDFSGLWPGYASRSIPFVSTQMTDNSDLEPDVGDRSVRFTVSFTVRGWLFLPPIELARVQKILIEAHLVPAGTDLPSVSAAEVDANPSKYPLAFQRTYDEAGGS